MIHEKEKVIEENEESPKMKPKKTKKEKRSRVCKHCLKDHKVYGECEESKQIKNMLKGGKQKIKTKDKDQR